MDRYEEYINEQMWKWAEARRIAKLNTTLMLEGNYDNKVMLECASRMKVLQECEAALLDLGVRDKIPQQLRNYIDARLDKGCSLCWFSSSGEKHADCRKKIDRYFDTEETLAVYAGHFCDPAKT